MVSTANLHPYKTARDPWNLSFSWSAAIQMPLFELCRGKDGLQLEDMSAMYLENLKVGGAAATGDYARSGTEGDHVPK